MTASAPCRTFANPSSATLAHLGGRPIAVEWAAAPEDGVLAVPSEVGLASSYDAVALDDGRMILTPTGAPVERAETPGTPAVKTAATADKRAVTTSAAGTAKAATSRRSGPVPSEAAKKSATRPRKRS